MKTINKMTHGALFNGVGGFCLAAEMMGWDNVMSCEIDPFCNHVTKYYWPNCTQHEDIRTADFSIYRGRIDVLSGGFPCQPYSTAGKRLGKEDDRHLWPEMLRAIREIQPCFVVGENVRGLISWNGGLVFDEVQADLEAEGYEVVPFLLPACGVNAPHRRDRIWFVAHSTSVGRWTDTERGLDESRQLLQNRKWQEGADEFVDTRKRRDAANADSGERCEGRVYSLKPQETGRYVSAFDSWDGGKAWDNFPTQSPVRGGDDGLPSRLSGITVSRHRRESIKALGNAIVPQVAYQIFKAIQLSLNKQP